MEDAFFKKKKKKRRRLYRLPPVSFNDLRLQENQTKQSELTKQTYISPYLLKNRMSSGIFKLSQVL